MKPEQIEQKLATKCDWCLGRRTVGIDTSKIVLISDQYWCTVCGGSGLKRTSYMLSVSDTIVPTYPRISVTKPAPYLKTFNE